MESRAEDGVLLARVEEALENAEARSRPYFVGFLDERQAQLARSRAQARGAVFSCEGGYASAQRVLFGAFPPDWEPAPERFPVAPVTVSFRKGAGLTHRDLLGSLMSLGIERDVLGDLLLEDGRAVFFTKAELAPFFLAELKKVGGEGVRACEGADEPLPDGGGFTEISATVASPRLDCVVAVLCRCGRAAAAERIEQGSVQLDYVECTAVSRAVAEGDRISVRGAGKFVVDRIGPQTKKGRLGLSARKYG